MSFKWVSCFLCSGEGKLEIGENYNKFFGHDIITCPLCDGRRQLAIKDYKENPRNRDMGDRL